MNVSPYIFGTMSLGKDPADPATDLALLRRAMEAGIWFHGSRTYNNGFSFMTLKLAFDADRAHVPDMILKIRDGSPTLMRFETEDSLLRLGLDTLPIAQLTSMSHEPGCLIDQLNQNRGPLLDELASLKARGLIQKAVLFLTPANADAGVAAASHPLIDGITFYWNATQREVTDTAWAAIQAENIPVLALRTLGGGQDPKLADKRAAIARAFPETDPVRLALNLAASVPEIRGTIGGTASLDHFEAFLSAARHAAPLAPEALAQIDAIRRA
ncbi:MAG: hypothetical protein JJU05_01290 [Verrucomicrobia bacterium]|nr:hypothetical protein [Verrucomicrobiota bacterium]MCH8525882.1 hypothetical protein [Kiritimatiellia bacterium]